MTKKRKSKSSRPLFICLAIFLCLGLASAGYFKFFYKADSNNSTPTAPDRLITVDNLDRTQISLQWADNSNDEQGFIIGRAPNMGLGIKELARVGANSTKYTDSAVAGQRYYYAIKSYNSKGESGWSNIDSPTREEKMDLFLGKGDFEKSSLTSMKQYDSIVGGEVGNYKIPEIGKDEIADAWRREIPYSVDGNYVTSENIISSINHGDGLNGSNSQFLSIKNLNTAENSNNPYMVKLGTAAGISGLSDRLHQGDTAEFKIDKIQIANSQNLPNSSTVSYEMYCMMGDSSYDYGTEQTHIISNSDQAGNISININDSRATVVRCGIRIRFNGNIKNNDIAPSIKIDGAHLFVQRAGNYVTWQVPAPKKRTIMTQEVNFDPGSTPTNFYLLASNYDIAGIAPDDYASMSMIRNLNPNIKLFSYYAANMVDNRFYQSTTQQYFLSFFSSQFINFKDALDHHQDDWFYKYTTGADGKPVCGNYQPFTTTWDTRISAEPTTASPNPKRLYKEYNDSGPLGGDANLLNLIHGTAGYPTEYLTNLSSPTYQEAWANNVGSAVKRMGLEGVFIDVMQPTDKAMTCTGSLTQDATVTPDQVQSFSSYVIPKLREMGLSAMPNGDGRHYSTWPGKAFLNPAWDPSNTSGNTSTCGVKDDSCWVFDSTKYHSNTKQNTAQYFFNESAFIYANYLSQPNNFNLNFWLLTLDDMDSTLVFNQGVTDEALKKRASLQVLANDVADGPYDGVNGWGQFAIGSYLLGENDFTSLGIQRNTPGLTSQGRPRFSFFDDTENLGQPIEVRNQNPNSAYTDKSLQSRQFENGLVVVNGVGCDTYDVVTGKRVCANSADDSRKFTLDRPMVDSLGNVYSAGEITLPPHTGRILFNLPLVKASIVNSPSQRQGYYVANPQVKLEPVQMANNDASKIFYKIDGSDFIEFKVSQITIPDGIHTLTFYGQDSSNHTGKTVTQEFKVKTTKPSKPTASSIRSFTYKSSLDLSGTVSAETTKLAINNDPPIFLSNTSWLQQMNLSLGSNSFNLKSEDYAGNESDINAVSIIRRKPADADGDNSVNMGDFSRLMANWGKQGSANDADFDENNNVGMSDFSILMNNWGK